MAGHNFRSVFVLRTPQMLGRYRKHMKENGDNIAFFFTSPALKQWKHWRLIKNDFPYDVLTRKHHILTPRRIFANDEDMTSSERKELTEIKRELKNDYDSLLENFVHQRTFRQHYHLHLICYKYKDEDDGKNKKGVVRPRRNSNGKPFSHNSRNDKQTQGTGRKN